LKEKIDAHCERVLLNELASIKELNHIVKSATSAMTSVPKPFKFLKTHYAPLTELFKALPDSQ
jgi:26S proteasome regulatory subunit N1